MPTIEISSLQILNNEIQIDLHDLLPEVEIELDECDIQTGIDEDPESYMAYLVAVHLGGKVTKALIDTLRNEMGDAELLAFCSKLTAEDVKESAA